MAFTGFSNRPMYNIEDPFCEGGREPDDYTNTLDHFFIKLLKVAEMACTESGKKECMRRTDLMHKFLSDLNSWKRYFKSTSSHFDLLTDFTNDMRHVIAKT